MKAIVLLALIISIISCKPHDMSNLKISFGKASDMKSSVVSLLLIKQNGTASNCTGSIIKERGSLLLLTASHCVEGVKDVFIVDSRNPGERLKDWQKRIFTNKRRPIKVTVQSNREYMLAKNDLERSSNDFALGLVEKNKNNASVYEKFKQNALTIGYDIDTKPDNLVGNIKYIGAGNNQSGNLTGNLLEGDFNIAPKQIPSPNLILVDACDSNKICSSTRPGDSGSPLIYTDPETKEKKVIGVLFGGRTDSESLYANLGGGRFKKKIDGVIDELRCTKR